MEDLEKEQVGSVNSEKKLWQMTKDEYEAKFGTPKGNTTVTGRFSRHKNAVEIALNRGLPVPDIVLKDYPDLIE